MKRLLNSTTFTNDIEVVGQDWSTGRQVMDRFAFDGFEIYPVDGYPLDDIPNDLVAGLHLRFFVFMWDLWRGDMDGLVRTFGDLETARNFYGGLDRSAVIDCYKSQLAWGRRTGAEYAVFHAAQADWRGVVSWEFPWTWQQTIDMSAQIVNSACADENPGMPILFENLWWPGGLRFEEQDEVQRLFDGLDIDDFGLVLDTGHMLNTNQDIRTEAQGVEYILRKVEAMGPMAEHIRAVHLTRSLSGEYVSDLRASGKDPLPDGSFWDKLMAAHVHVSNIDEHEAFEDSGICRLFDLIDPQWVVYEFTFKDLDHWTGKIKRQCRAMAPIFGEP